MVPGTRCEAGAGDKRSPAPPKTCLNVLPKDLSQAAGIRDRFGKRRPKRRQLPANIHNVRDAVTTQIRVSRGDKAQGGIDGDLDIQVVNDTVGISDRKGSKGSAPPPRPWYPSLRYPIENATNRSGLICIGIISSGRENWQ